MAFAHCDRGEPAIEEMTAPAALPVDEIRPPAVRGAQRAPQAVLIARAKDEVHVIGHQAIRPDLHRRLAHLLGEHVAIDVLVAVFEEDRFAAVAARRHMMGAAGNDDASQSRHAPS